MPTSEFPVLAAVFGGVGTAGGAFWLAFSKFSSYVDAKVSESEKRCQEKITGLELEIREVQNQLKSCKGASVHFVNILGLTREVEDSLAGPIIDEARKGIEVLK